MWLKGSLSNRDEGEINQELYSLQRNLCFRRFEKDRGPETEQRVVQMSSEKDKVTYMLQ